MGHRTQPGKILENTYLLDGNFFGMSGLLATYVVKGRQSVLIDSGTRDGAKDIIQALKDMDLFPVDKIILTHEHWDHVQGAVSLVRAMGPDVAVHASSKAKPFIEDPTKISYDFGGGIMEPVANIIALEEGDVVDLGGVKLEVIDVPGHSPGHIALYDGANRNVFLGDSIGNKIDPTTFIPSHNPPWFDREAFYATLAKLKEVEFNTVCLAHYGCWDSVDAENILEEAKLVFDNFWEFFESNRDGLDDVDYLSTSLRERYLPNTKLSLAGLILVVGWLRDGFEYYYHLR